MTFKIFRSSDGWCCELRNKPCKNAKILETGTYAGKFVWCVELNTLEDLIQLCYECYQDSLIVSVEPNCIEICDDFA